MFWNKYKLSSILTPDIKLLVSETEIHKNKKNARFTFTQNNALKPLLPAL